MNIIQVSPGELRIPPEKGGGIEQYILNISKYLSLTGRNNVTILDRKFSVADPDVEYIDGVKVVRLNARRFNLTLLKRLSDFIGSGLPVGFISFALSQISFSRQVRKYLARADYDIINVHSSIMTTFLAMASSNLREKLFFTCHATRRERESQTWQDKIAFTLEGQAVKRSTKVIAPSDEMRQKLIVVARVQPEHVILIPVGVDVNMFNPNLELGNVRQKYGTESKFAILSVGVISQRKGTDYLVKAANIVVNEFGYKQAKFLLVGPSEGFGPLGREESPYLHKIMRLIEEYGLRQNVKLTGVIPVDDLRKLYAACDIFVLPSLAEMMATAILEAMASGKPVIATKTYGVSAQVRNGQSGFIIDPANEQLLADRIKYLINNSAEREKMGAYGRRLAEDKFDWSKITKRLLMIYKTGLVRN